MGPAIARTELRSPSSVVSLARLTPVAVGIAGKSSKCPTRSPLAPVAPSSPSSEAPGLATPDAICAPRLLSRFSASLASTRVRTFSASSASASTTGSTNTTALSMVTSFRGLSRSPVSTAPRRWRTSMPPTTLPKTLCLLSRCGVSLKVMKN
eukprot:scaffold1954_cov268-Pinguiococcus_pyrenoidosus.AAC.298